LADAVNVLGDELATGDSASFRLVVEGPVRDLHPIVRDELYGITREALRNAFSHARAQHIEVEITYAERLFQLRIRDDGDGIAPGILEEGRSGHYGLPGMRERAKKIDAKLDIWSGMGTGTEIDLSIAGSIAYRASPARSRFHFFKKQDGQSPFPKSAVRSVLSQSSSRNSIPAASRAAGRKPTPAPLQQSALGDQVANLRARPDQIQA
jgi:hypothetical protein